METSRIAHTQDRHDPAQAGAPSESSIFRDALASAKTAQQDQAAGGERLSAWERAGSCLRMIGGGVQMGAGAFAAANVEIPVVAQVVGGIAVAHGYSDYEIGSRQCFSGQRGDDSLFQKTVSATAQVAGADKQTADRIGTGADLIAGFVNPAGPWGSTPGLAVQATNGRRLMTAGSGGTSSPQRLAEASNAIHASTTMMSVTGGESGDKTQEVDPDRTAASASGEIEPRSETQNIASSELGEKLGDGGNKNVYAYGPDKAVGVLKDGIKPKAIAEELQTLDKLKQHNVPTVNASQVSVDGKPAMMMDRYAQGSKTIVKLDQGKIRTVGDSSLLNEKSIADLTKIRDTMIEKKIKIDDLQFLIGKDGSVVVADPLAVNAGEKPSRNNLSMIRQLIETAQQNMGRR
jgi:hypothetical protein